jgi:hypothetical protein
MRRFGILALALTMFGGAAAISFAQDAGSGSKSTGKKNKKKKKNPTGTTKGK